MIRILILACCVVVACNREQPPRSEPTTVEERGAQATDAVDALREYYAAISSRDYERAYKLWGPTGPPKQTLEEFRRGFEETESVQLETGKPSRVEPAAGSHYVEIPVTITARTTSGETQRFEGTYTLRRVVVDGAPEASRRWHIHRATLRRV